MPRIRPGFARQTGTIGSVIPQVSALQLGYLWVGTLTTLADIALAACGIDIGVVIRIRLRVRSYESERTRAERRQIRKHGGECRGVSTEPRC